MKPWTPDYYWPIQATDYSDSDDYTAQLTGEEREILESCHLKLTFKEVNALHNAMESAIMESDGRIDEEIQDHLVGAAKYLNERLRQARAGVLDKLETLESKSEPDDIRARFRKR